MTDAERQARYRAARAVGKPVMRTRRSTDHRSRSRRWRDTVAALVDLQAEYAAWLEALPANLQDSSLGESLQAICDIDLAQAFQSRPSVWDWIADPIWASGQ